MKKTTKTKVKAKSKAKPAKKSAGNKKVNKKVSAKAKPAKAKVKAAVKSKAKAKPVKVKPKVNIKPVKKVVVAKAKPVVKVSAPKHVIQKEEPVRNIRPVEPRPIISSNNKMPYNKDEGRKIVPKTAKVDPNKTRYSDKELEEFREIIIRKLEDAKKELITLQAQLTSSNDHGTDDTANTFKMLEDGSDSLAKEEAGQLASRQRKFIDQLENALVRIENKTYGICRVTGKLIPKERLRAVPHTTQSIEAKLNQYRD
jgi:DnaK suppressor protein